MTRFPGVRELPTRSGGAEDVEDEADEGEMEGDGEPELADGAQAVVDPNAAA